MNYKSEIQKFITSQYIYSGVRITLSIVIPSIILAYFGLLKEFFLFPLGTSFVGLTDMVGPFHRRRNTLILAIVFFIFVALVTSFLRPFHLLIFPLIIIFGIFFSIIGVYGVRLSAVGGLTLVVFSIFIDGKLAGDNIIKNILIFASGCVWFFLVFMVLMKLQPYKLAGQLIGENYIQLSEYLKLKAKFYAKNPDYEDIYKQIIAKQVVIKNLQEETREVVFKTRTIVNESTTQSRLLMLMFLNSIDFYDKIITSDQDYRKIQNNFKNSKILQHIQKYLLILSNELNHIGIALQTGTETNALTDYKEEHRYLYSHYFEERNKNLSSKSLEKFMDLRIVLLRINELTDQVKTIYQVFQQDLKNAKSLSTGLDYEKFVPQQEKLNFKVLRNNFSLKSAMFRHAIRITVALLLGYLISKISVLNIGHSYWILITIIAIMRPAYSTTKHRNLLRLYGTILGAIVAYLVLIFIDNDSILLGLLFTSMVLCFSFLKDRYASAVFFMTIYIFIAFNFLNPGNVNTIFKDRILDTAIAGAIATAVSYFVLPVWERTQNMELMKFSLQSNLDYLKIVIENFKKKIINNENYRIKRKDAVIALANLSDNFQRMLSDPKNQQQKMEAVHQFVITSHLTTAYIASLSQYANTDLDFPEIDSEGWEQKISTEMKHTLSLLNNEPIEELITENQHIPEDLVEELLIKRKSEIEEIDFQNNRDFNRITKLTQLKNIREIFELLYDVAHEQRKVTENYLNFPKKK